MLKEAYFYNYEGDKIRCVLCPHKCLISQNQSGLCKVRKALKVDSKLYCSAVIIASGDLSHRLKEGGPYPYTPLGKEFDDKLISILQNGDLNELFSIDKDLIQEAGECGLRSLYIYEIS
ncbi:MAG: hypothetical protein ACRCXT_12035 [Paraclostridium sp.]